MKSVFIFAAVIALTLADSKVSFNSVDKCGTSKKDYTRIITSSDILNVQFRKPTTSLQHLVIKDECQMKFSIISISKPRLEVRFDSINKYINDPNVRLEFYDSDEVKVSKKIREVSKAYPINGTTIIKTTGSFLTIKGIRSVKDSNNYNVEFTIRPSSATTARWSFVAASVAAIIRFL